MARGLFRPLLFAVAFAASAQAFSMAPFLRTPQPATAAFTPRTAAVAPGRVQSLRRPAMGAVSVKAQFEWSGERVSVDGNVASYTEAGAGSAGGMSPEVGVIQASKPLTAARPYFEIKIEDGGAENFIGIGLATQGYPMNKQPGWDQVSVGWHADDGSYYRCPIPDEMSKSGRPNNMPLNGKPMPCQKGDVMGIGLEFDSRGPEPSGFPRRVFFTKNKQYLGSVLLEKDFHPCLYPTIGFNSPGAKAAIDMDCDFASVELAHTAQFFGTNEYATAITTDAIAAGAQCDVKDVVGRTPLHMAAAYGATPVAKLLVEKGADPDVQDTMGLTPMHMAAGYCRPSTIKFLVESGADPEVRTERNERALDLIRNMRNATLASQTFMVKDKRVPMMNEIVDVLEAVTEDTEEWVVPKAPELKPEEEAAMKEMAEKAKNMVEEMKKDPEKMKELEKAMELMKDKDFQEKVKQYANDPQGMKKLIEEFKDKV